MYLDFRSSNVGRDFPLVSLGKDGECVFDYCESSQWSRNTIEGSLAIAMFVPKTEEEDYPESWNIDDGNEDSAMKYVGSLAFKAYKLSGFDIDISADTFEAAQNSSSLLSAMDCYSDDDLADYSLLSSSYKKLMKSVNEISREEANFLADGYILCIKDFEILTEYSKNGIGEAVLNNISELMKLYFNFSPAILVMKKEELNGISSSHFKGNNYVSSNEGNVKWVYEVE